MTKAAALDTGVPLSRHTEAAGVTKFKNFDAADVSIDRMTRQRHAEIAQRQQRQQRHFRRDSPDQKIPLWTPK
jgi:hypothetical protein